MAFTPTPIVALHRAVAIAETEGPDAALDLVDRLRLDGYHLFHAVRADLLRRSGRLDEAARVYRNALELTENPAERRLLQRRRDELR
jgi:RNA polymerase sigma-70 factor (ECF subfamily)